MKSDQRQLPAEAPATAKGRATGLFFQAVTTIVANRQLTSRFKITERSSMTEHRAQVIGCERSSEDRRCQRFFVEV